jgi:hypothetical protein
MDINKETKIKELIERSKLDSDSKELLHDFFYNITDQPQFDKIIDLLDRFPAVFDNFCLSFDLKKQYLEGGATESQWNDYLAKEKDALDKLEQ